MAEESKQQLQTNVNFAGDVNAVNVTIVTTRGVTATINSSIKMSVSLYESIFSPFITGTITIYDAVDLQQVLPLVGEELVQIQIIQNDQTYERAFMISKMRDREVIGSRNQAYVLEIISTEAIVNENVKLSRAFKGPIDNIIDELINSVNCLNAPASKKTAFIEQSTNSTMFVANYWNPVKCIQYVCEQARNLNDSPSFLFFENKSGFYFWSLDNIADAQVAVSWTFRRDAYSNQPADKENIENKYSRIIDISITDFDIIKRMKTGMYGSTIIYYDLSTGQYVEKATTTVYTPKLNQNPGWSSKAPFSNLATLIVDHQHYNNFDGYGSETANTKVRQDRLATLARYESQKLTITVFGRLQIEAGQKVFLDIPSFSVTAESTQNKYMSGNYIISDCHHSFGKDGYFCNMNVIKDSYIANLEE
jgi:hypothetical protein